MTEESIFADDAIDNVAIAFHRITNVDGDTYLDAGLHFVSRDGFAALGDVGDALAVFVGARTCGFFQHDRGAGLERGDRAVAFGGRGGGAANGSASASCGGAAGFR